MASLQAVASELTTEPTEDSSRSRLAAHDQHGGAYRRYKAGPPAFNEPVPIPSAILDRAIDYFDFGPTKDAVVLVPDLNRHVLSMAVAAEGVRQLTQVSAVSQPLQGPVDRAAAAMPTARGVTAPGRSPYDKALPNRRRSVRPEPELPGLPMRPLAALTMGTMVGSAASSVRRARRKETASSRQLPAETGAPYAAALSPQSRKRSEASGEASGSGITNTMSVGSGMADLYAPAHGRPAPIAGGGVLGGAGDVGGESSIQSEGLRHYYLSRYAPPLHVPPSDVLATADGAGKTVRTDPGVTEDNASSGGPAIEEQDPLEQYLHHVHGRQHVGQHHSRSSSLSGTPDTSGPLPSLDSGLLQPPAAAPSTASFAASSTTSNPISSARLCAQERQHTLAHRSEGWRRSLAPDVDGAASHRTSSAFRSQLHATYAPAGAYPADWSRHSVHTVTPELTPRGGLLSPRDRTAAAEPGGGAGAVAAAAEANGGQGAREATSGARARTSRGRPRVVHVDPELVRQYTERPPKLCTPNNASRPVTSSDFAAFKNHTVNRSGAPNTLRTPLGSAVDGAAAGAPGGPGGAVAAEVRGVPPLSALLGPPWLPPAMRPRSPHVGVGGISGSATSVPGLFVPLELDPPVRVPPASPRQAQSSAPPEAVVAELTSTSVATTTAGLLPPPSQAPVVSARAPNAGPAPVRCGAGELALDVNAWLTPVSAPGSELCGVFYGDEGGDSVALLSRVVKGTVQCDLGWAEISESLMFMSSSVVPNAVLRFALPHRAVLQRFAATIGGTTMIAEAVARNGGNGLELDEEDEDDDSGPGKLFSKAFGRRNHPSGPGGRAPMLRVPLGRVKGDIFVTVSYLVQLDISGNTLSLTHVCNWTPPRSGWHLMTREQLAAEWYGGSGPGRKGRQKASDLYDLSFELEILSHRGLNLVSGPRHMTIKPNYDALLIQGFTQVWRPRHVTQVIFEVALPVPIRSFAILHDARKPDADMEATLDVPHRRAPQPAAEASNAATQHSQSANGGSGEPGRGSFNRSRTLKLMISPALSQTNSTALLGGELGGPFHGRRPQTAADAQQETYSRRNCAAVTFVPTSHFSPADLEEALGDEVAPGPRAQAAALRAGLPGTPPPVPVELLIVVDCCGPTGMASHLMQMMQTLLLLLRSLPAADGSATVGAGAGGAAAAAAAIAAAGMFNVVICPAAPPQQSEAAEGAEAQPNPMWPRELAVLHSARRQQQQHILQQHLQGQTPRAGEASSPSRSPSPSQAPSMPPTSPPHGAVPPVWLFPGGSRPVTGEAVEAALAWVSTLLADPNALVAWAQPVSRLHEMLCELDRRPQAPGCRRAALLLCQQLVSATGEDGGSAFSAPHGSPDMSNATSRNISRSNSRRSSNSRLQPRRAFGRTSMQHAQPQAGSRRATMQAVAEEDAVAEPGLGRVDSEPTSPTGATALRRGLSFRSEAGPHVAFGSSPQPADAALHAAHGRPADPAPLDAGPLGSPFITSEGGHIAAHAKPPLPEQRPRSSFARGLHSRGGTPGSNGTDGVHWGAGSRPSSRRAITDVGIPLSDAEAADAAARHRPSSPDRSADEGLAAGTGTDVEDVVSLAPAIPDPPDLSFPVFVVVHSLQPFSHAALMAGAGGALANGPSYLMAYQMYQRHLEALLYERAREEVQQLPMSYLERLADGCGGFLQTASSAHELGSALVLAASCAVSGRYLRQLRLVARGSVMREMYPPKLPAALPLSEPLSLLVRLSRMHQGAALVLHGVWPSGRPVTMEVSVDPKLKTPGTLLPVLCALSEVSVLLKDLAPLAAAAARQPSVMGYTATQGGSATNTGATNTGAHNTNPTSPTRASGLTAATSRRSAVGRISSSQQLLEEASVPPPQIKLTAKQQAARKRAMDRSLEFNVVTPFTAMALVSMTLAGNRGLAVQTLQTTANSRPNDYRTTGNFLWPSPIMAVLTATAKEAAAAAAQAQMGAAFHTAASFAQLAGAAQGQGQADGGMPGEAGDGDADDWGTSRGDTNVGSEFSDLEGRHGPGTGRRRESRGTARRRSLALPEMPGGGLAGLRPGALGIPPEFLAMMSPDGAAQLRRTGSSSPTGSRRSSSMEPFELLLGLMAPNAAHRPGANHDASPAHPSVLSPPASDALHSAAAGSPLAAAQGATPESPCVQAETPPPPAVPPVLQLDGLKATSGPIGPPITAAEVTAAHALAVLGRLALLQQADGSWPASAELEELVLSNGRHLHVPMLGGPKPETQIERHAADVREARLRDSLSGLREHTLRNAVAGPAWATILALALLRGKYWTQRLAWIAMEAKAFAWLQRKWPPPVVCAVSPPAAIMKVSALL